jgi:four helix bundle protein
MPAPIMEKGVRSQESGVGGKTPDSKGERAPSRTFEDLIVWQKAHAWVLAVYRFTRAFPQNELYGLVSQFRRAAVSIPANIAEGYKKFSVADKRRFMNIAQGSLEECRYYLILARDLEYGDSAQLMTQLAEVSRLLNAYAKAIATSGSSNS